ncbi:MAG: MaoC family dehydratase N-terminal domain-containing protein [Dehalococcoidia bacterium]|nr:MaoC family dehydratase N-terminal domain-containing protein [Dehalococcoidia bacterium]
MTEKEQTPARTRGNAKYTWDDTVAAIGRDFSTGTDRIADEVIEYTSVARFCEPWEIGNPIYWYVDVARQAGYKGVVVPWSEIKQTTLGYKFWRPGEPTRFPTNDKNADSPRNYRHGEPSAPEVPTPPIKGGLVTDLEIEFFEPVCVGDRLRSRGNKLVNVRVRNTRIGVGAFVNMAYEIYNQDGKLVAKVNQGGYSYNPK